jgi:transposase
LPERRRALHPHVEEERLATLYSSPLEPLSSRTSNSTAWRLLPAKALGCDSRVTCWRRLRAWRQAGVWEQLHHRLLNWLGDDGPDHWSRAPIDSVNL